MGFPVFLDIFFRVFRRTHDNNQMLHKKPVEYLGLQVAYYLQIYYIVAFILWVKFEIYHLYFKRYFIRLKPNSNTGFFWALIIIVFQLQLINCQRFESVEDADIEFFYSRNKAILGWNGLPHPNPKVWMNRTRDIS